MAIDYIINHPCKAKDDLGAEGIIHLVKARHRAQALLERFIEQGMRRDEAMNAQFGIQSVNQEGASEVQMVTVGSLFKQAELLDDHKDTCAECPANCGNPPFGCYQSINYPLSEVAEEWIANMAAKAIEAGMPNSILLQFILDQNVTGESFSRMRGDHHRTTYLQAALPIEVEVLQESGIPLVIDTNQLLEMFFAVGEMQEVHQQFLLFFTGALTIQEQAPDFAKLGNAYQIAVIRSLNGTQKYWIFHMPDSLKDDRTIRQLKSFFRAVFAAQANRASLTVDF